MTEYINNETNLSTGETPNIQVIKQLEKFLISDISELNNELEPSGPNQIIIDEINIKLRRYEDVIRLHQINISTVDLIIFTNIDGIVHQLICNSDFYKREDLSSAYYERRKHIVKYNIDYHLISKENIINECDKKILLTCWSTDDAVQAVRNLFDTGHCTKRVRIYDMIRRVPTADMM